MTRIGDWYWQYGAKRVDKYVVSRSWLDRVMRLEEQYECIKSHESTQEKACIALWGQSQSGKSTLLASYLDNVPGAMCWTKKCHVKFCQNSAIQDPVDTLYFNPFHGGPDASGVVTRFLVPANGRVDDNSYPVELVLASNKLILHSLAVGYLNECRPETPYWTRSMLEKLILESPGGNDSPEEAFELLRDFCDVCEILGQGLSTPQFNIFNTDKMIRNVILESKIASSFQSVLSYIGKVIWNNTQNLTNLLSRLIVARKHIGNRNLHISMELAAVLEDIDSLKVMERYDGVISTYETLQKNVAQSMTQHIKEQGISCSFGYLQALVDELRVPIKLPTNNADAFSSLLQTHDLLDMPGVTRRANAVAAAETLLLDPNTASETDLLTRVYKTGKTIALIHQQAQKITIDSFCIFVGLNAGHISKPGVLDNGIRAWLSGYDEEWQTGQKACLPVYLNFSLLGKIVTDVLGVHGGLQGIVSLATSLPFARKDMVEILFTNNQYSPFAQNKNLFFDRLRQDPDFSQAFLDDSSCVSLAACERDGLGIDHVFTRLQEVTKAKRIEKYGIMKDKIRRELKKLLAQHLPEAHIGFDYGRFLAEVHDRAMASYQNNMDGLFLQVRKLLTCDRDWLSPLPTQSRDYRTYIHEQLVRWVQHQSLVLSANDFVDIVGEGDGMFRHLLEALAFVDEQALCDFAMKNFFGCNDNGARGVLASLIVNVMTTGTISYPTAAGINFPSPNSVLPNYFIWRLETLMGNPPGAPQRPVQAGDNELQALMNII